jgi:hypothetical protein
MSAMLLELIVEVSEHADILSELAQEAYDLRCRSACAKASCSWTRDPARIMAEVKLMAVIIDQEPDEWHRLEHSVIFQRDLDTPSRGNSATAAELLGDNVSRALGGLLACLRERWEFLTVGVPQTLLVSQNMEVKAHDVCHGRRHKTTGQWKWIERCTQSGCVPSPCMVMLSGERGSKARFRNKTRAARLSMG